MKLAERMNRIGVEGAFKVLARARALEAQGRDIIHLEIGEPDFDTPAHIVEAASERSMKALRIMLLRPDCRNCAQPSRRMFPARAAYRLVPSAFPSSPAASP